MAVRTHTRPVARHALAVGDFLFIDGVNGEFALVVGRPSTLQAHIMFNTGRIVHRALDRTEHVAVGVPVEDFGPQRLQDYVVEQEAEARAAQARAERLRLAVEAVRQVQANQPGAAAEFARVIGQR